MNSQGLAGKPAYCLLPMEIDGFDALAELALVMRWSWNHCADENWRHPGPALWELTHNPRVVLQTVARDQIERVLADPAFRLQELIVAQIDLADRQVIGGTPQFAPYGQELEVPIIHGRVTPHSARSVPRIIFAL